MYRRAFGLHGVVLSMVTWAKLVWDAAVLDYSAFFYLVKVLTKDADCSLGAVWLLE